MFKYLDDDIVNLRRDDGREEQFFWGDRCRVLKETPAGKRIEIHGRRGEVIEGTVSPKTTLRDDGLLRLSMVDVQQGDGLILETPGGKIIFIDGGDNQLFARHANARFPVTSEDDPLIVDLMLITHGDADHFAGLSKLRQSETDRRLEKRIFVAPKRVYHNGLVKRPSGRPDAQLLGGTNVVGPETYIVDLVDDPGAVAPAERNKPFEDWVQTLDAWEPRVQAKTGKAIEKRRLDHTSEGAFDFLKDENVEVELLGPLIETVNGKPALRFLTDPPKDANLMLGTKRPSKRGALSASHTINGHSINFRLRYGNVRFMFTGDMNQEASQRLRETLPGAALRSES